MELLQRVLSRCRGIYTNEHTASTAHRLKSAPSPPLRPCPEHPSRTPNLTPPPPNPKIPSALTSPPYPPSTPPPPHPTHRPPSGAQPSRASRRKKALPRALPPRAYQRWPPPWAPLPLHLEASARQTVEHRRSLTLGSDAWVVYQRRVDTRCSHNPSLTPLYPPSTHPLPTLYPPSTHTPSTHTPSTPPPPPPPQQVPASGISPPGGGVSRGPASEQASDPDGVGSPVDPPPHSFGGNQPWHSAMNDPRLAPHVPRSGQAYTRRVGGGRARGGGISVASSYNSLDSLIVD